MGTEVRGGGRGSIVLLLAAAALLLRPWEVELGGTGAPPAAIARVVRVVDGDTIEARIGGAVEDVRYIGVDTPETVKPGTPVQCFGPEASAFNHRLLEGRRVRLVFGVERRDAYGRLLAYVYITTHSRRRFVNEMLLRRGLARTLAIPPNTRYSALFAARERGAARSGRGLWGACPP
ncbi:MAG TPA: thermonuclease family protein [Solirubrobacterales bacterium]|nr:thermonuclease family protein [Solirubrobacterales bacterium]